jgi:hypothetical protein
MAEGDFGNRARTAEDDYFYKKDRELIEKFRKAAADEKARSEMAAQIRINDPGLIDDLKELGFTPETVKVLPLMPIVQLAWAEGGVSSAERTLLVSLARNRGIAEGSPGDQLLSDWMTRAPSPATFTNAMRLIRAMLDAAPAGGDAITADDIMRYCELIAEASGGIFGIGRVSSEERATLAQIADELKKRS